MDELDQFIANLHPVSKVLAWGTVDYENAKGKPVTGRAVLIRTSVGQEWAWTMGKRGIENIHPCFFTPDSESAL